ncbi:MAG: ribonuclease Z [Chloroflexi bacterium]|nr:ribonuclease Z [Chloroflexota bacterium]
MFEYVFLGTSASAPSIKRNLTSNLLIHTDQRIMIDCGEGTQRQLLRSGLGFKRLDKIFLTHGHLDHILGLGGIVSTFARWEAISNLQIYAGAWALARVRDLLEVVLRGGEVEMHLDYRELKPGLIFQTKAFEVRAFPVTHRGTDCFGFIFEEYSRRPFLAEQADALGVPQGPERRYLVSGEAITLADGRIITPDEVLGPVVQGTKLVHVGDASRIDDLLPYVRGADALVIEATYADADQDFAYRYGHLTSSMAATLAREAQVHQLFLTHISRRYTGREIAQEARAIFPNTILAEDLDQVRIQHE